MTKPNMKPILDKFYGEAEALATEAQALDTDAKQRAKVLAQDMQQDAQDRAALAEMERQVAALKAKVEAQAEDLAVRRAQLEEIERQRDEKTAEAEAIVGIVEREKARIAAELAQQAPVMLPGAVPAGSPLETRRDALPPVEQDGSQP